MPTWHIDHPADLWTESEKSALATAITDWYHHHVGLPRFYVVVAFNPHNPSSFYRGGLSVTTQPSTPTHSSTNGTTNGTSTTNPKISLSPTGPPTANAFIRIAISHIARGPRSSTPDPAAAAKVHADFDAILRPFTADRGVGCEYHWRNDERLYWRVDGLTPPAGGSEEERMWEREGWAVPY